MVPTSAGFELDAETYHRRSATHRFEYDPADTPPTMAVVSALSSIRDVSPVEMEPIAETVDTDAVDALVDDSDAADGDVEVSWTQAGHDVTVSCGGAVAVSKAGDGHSESSVDG